MGSAASQRLSGDGDHGQSLGLAPLRVGDFASPCREGATGSRGGHGLSHPGTAEAEGLLNSEWVESEAGHPRKYYWLTSAGQRRIKEMARAWHDFSGNLSMLVR